MIIFILAWFVIALIGLLLFLCHMVKKSLDERGLELKKKKRRIKHTYDDGFGKFTVWEDREEWVTEPKNK